MASQRAQIPAQVDNFFRQSLRKSRSGRRRMLAITYEFDPAAFERAFTNLLRWPVQIDIVAGQSFSGSIPGVRCWRGRWQGTFHPKMICLLTNERVCVGFGSANLTSGGLGENLETWRFFEGSEDRAVLVGARDFLTLLEERHILPRAVRCREIIEALPSAKGRSAVLSTLHGRLLDQVVSRVHAPVRRVDIVSPINCDPAPVLRGLRTTVEGQPEYHLFASEDPVPRVRGITVYHRLERPERDDNGEGLRAVSSAHAKIYAFETRNHVDLFWGSANLSYSAWLAHGNGANIDLLIHSRVRPRDWQSFRDRSLPPGHRWVNSTPRGEPPRGDPEGQEAGWRLLHAMVEGGAVTLEASGSGRIRLHLRAIGHRAVACDLQFIEGLASLSEKTATYLGFADGNEPRLLEWRLAPAGSWQQIPVNLLDELPGSGRFSDLAQQLFWEFAGRILPGTRLGTKQTSSRKRYESGSRKRSTSDGPRRQDGWLPRYGIARVDGEPGDAAKSNYERDQVSLEEDELTRSEHQGELDRFVLEWRLIARRVAFAGAKHPRLKTFYVDSILDRLNAETQRLPSKWPSFKRDFVRELLKRKWPA